MLTNQNWIGYSEEWTTLTTQVTRPPWAWGEPHSNLIACIYEIGWFPKGKFRCCSLKWEWFPHCKINICPLHPDPSVRIKSVLPPPAHWMSGPVGTSLCFVAVGVLVAKSCPTLWDPMDCSPPGSSIHGISQARILEWAAISFSRGYSWPRDRTPHHLHGQAYSLPLHHQRSSLCALCTRKFTPTISVYKHSGRQEPGSPRYLGPVLCPHCLAKCPCALEDTPPPWLPPAPDAELSHHSARQLSTNLERAFRSHCQPGSSGTRTLRDPGMLAWQVR